MNFHDMLSDLKYESYRGRGRCKGGGEIGVGPKESLASSFISTGPCHPAYGRRMYGFFGLALEGDERSTYSEFPPILDLPVHRLPYHLRSLNCIVTWINRL